MITPLSHINTDRADPQEAGGLSFQIGAGHGQAEIDEEQRGQQQVDHCKAKRITQAKELFLKQLSGQQQLTALKQNDHGNQRDLPNGRYQRQLLAADNPGQGPHRHGTPGDIQDQRQENAFRQSAVNPQAGIDHHAQNHDTVSDQQTNAGQ